MVSRPPAPIAGLFDQLVAARRAGDGDAIQDLIAALAEIDLPDAARNLFDALRQRMIGTARPQRPRRSEPSLLLSSISTRAPLDGFTIVSCSMNRNENLRRSLESWLSLGVDELVIVDWSSTQPVADALADIDDPRLRILRVEGEMRWILTYAFNVGLQYAGYSRVIKLDADISVSHDFLHVNRMDPGEFVRGNWQVALDAGKRDQVFVNGSFAAFKKDLLAAGFYNENIRSYGWDDSDLYDRLEKLGLRPRYLTPDSVVHSQHDTGARLAHQSVARQAFLGVFEPTEFYNVRNRYMTGSLPRWQGSGLQDYSVASTGPRTYLLQRVSADVAIPPDIDQQANRLAVVELLHRLRPAWAQRLRPASALLELVHDDFASGTDADLTLVTLGLQGDAGVRLAGSADLGAILREEGARTAANNTVVVVDRRIAPIALVWKGRSIVLRGASADAYAALAALRPDDVGARGQQATRVDPVAVLVVLETDVSYRAADQWIQTIAHNLQYFRYCVAVCAPGGSLADAVTGSALDGERIVIVRERSEPAFNRAIGVTRDLFPNAVATLLASPGCLDTSLAHDAVSGRNHRDVVRVLSGRFGQELPGAQPCAWAFVTPLSARLTAAITASRTTTAHGFTESLQRAGVPMRDVSLSVGYQLIDPPPEPVGKGVQPDFAQARRPQDTPVRHFRKTLCIEIDTTARNLVASVIVAIMAMRLSDHGRPPFSVCLRPRIDGSPDGLTLALAIRAGLGNECVWVGGHYGPTTAVDPRSIVRAYLDPSAATAAVAQGSVSLDLPTDDDLLSYLLLRSLTLPDLQHLRDLFETLVESGFRDLLAYRDELGIACSQFDRDANRSILDAWLEGKPLPDGQPKLAYVTSVFKGDAFFASFLRNIAAAALEANAEVVIVNPNSPHDEAKTFHAFVDEYEWIAPRFTYVALTSDPGLYNCWRTGIERSRAPWISNANIDDRRSPFHGSCLLRLLDAQPHLSGAATAIRATSRKNASWYAYGTDAYWFERESQGEIGFDSLYLEPTPGTFRSRNIMHCMPVWSRELHHRHGYFDEETYGTSADWAFWLECTRKGERFGFTPQALAMYLINETSHNRVNDADGTKELRIISHYLGGTQSAIVKQ